MLNIPSIPSDEPRSSLYAVTSGEKELPVYVCRVSAVPLNQVWPGYQRPIDQTEEAAFVKFTFDGEVTLQILPAKDFKSVAVKPASREIEPHVKNGVVTITLTRPGQYTVEPDDYHGALHIFADSPCDYGIAEGERGTLWFGAGAHDVGIVELSDDQTVYIDDGAIVYGGFKAVGKKNIRILGRGIIDNSRVTRENGLCLCFTDCENLTVSGPVIRDASVWTLACHACTHVLVDDVKLIGMWRYNSDGVDFCNCHDAELRDSFLRNFDDCVVVKGLQGSDRQTVDNIRVHNCVVWCDWGRGLELGAETVADEFNNVTFRDIDIIRTAHIAMDIQSGDRADIHDVTFENIRVEYDDVTPEPVLQSARDEVYKNPNGSYMPYLMFSCIYDCMWSRDKTRGVTRGVTFRDICVTAPAVPPSSFDGFDAEHMTSGVLIENLTVNGNRLASLADANVKVGEFAEEITIK